MPHALKVFIWSLIAGLGTGYVTLRVGLWIATRFFRDDPLAVAVVALATLALSVAAAVTAGVTMGKARGLKS